MKKIVVLFIDAFSHSYINSEDTPFLSTQDVRSLTPVFGFKQLGAAFGGLDPLSTGFFAEYYFDPDHSPYRWSRIFPLPLLSAMELLRVPINVIARYMSPQKVSISRLVPLEMAKFFNKDSRAYPDNSPVITSLGEKGLTHRLVFSPRVKTNMEAFNLLERLHHSNQIPQFLLIHFSSLDPATHSFGLKSEPVRELVRQVDWIIKEAVDMLGDSYLIVFSDHGMLEVKGFIDVLNKIKAAGSVGKEFVVFLDSIMARFWIFTDSALEAITQILTSEPNGQLFPLENQGMWDRFGNLLFLASPGYLIYPNYYDRKPPKAMHGYDVPLPSESPLNGILLTKNIPNLTLPERLSMSDLYPILKQAIESL